MSTPADRLGLPGGGGSDPADERWELVLRMAESVQFRKSPKLRELLMFVCERGLHNANDDLKEQRIGCLVFGRRNDYNPGEDNIVRVEIRLLRKRIDEYFTMSGKDEPLVVTIPKGSYVPCFESRKIEERLKSKPDLELIPVSVPASPKAGDERAAKWFWPALAATLAILCLVSWLPRSKPVLQGSMPVDKRAQIWPQIFNKDQDTYIVCADSALVILQEITRRPVTLSDYLARTYPNFDLKSGPTLNSLISVLGQRQYTSIADVHMVERLLSNNINYWDRTVVRSARTLHAIDFKTNNIVLLGSSRANPWTELFEPQLNFIWRFDEQHRQGLLINRTPKPGEPAVYRSDVPGHTTYSVVDFVPNLSRTGNVLVVAGATMEGTEGASEYVNSPAFAAEVVGPMHAVQNGKLLHFELVLQSGTLGGTSQASQVIANRVWPADSTP